MDTINLIVGQFEDTIFEFSVSGYDLQNSTLKSQIRDEIGTLKGEAIVTVISPIRFDLILSSAVTGLLIPGDYKIDVLATNNSGNKTFITPVMTLTVTDRVTEP